MKEPSITDILHTPIAIILDRYPQVSQVFIRNRMGCIGCAFSRFHALSDVMEIYQLEEETFLGEVRDLLGERDDLGTARDLFEEVSSQG